MSLSSLTKKTKQKKRQIWRCQSYRQLKLNSVNLVVALGLKTYLVLARSVYEKLNLDLGVIVFKRSFFRL